MPTGDYSFFYFFLLLILGGCMSWQELHNKWCFFKFEYLKVLKLRYLLWLWSPFHTLSLPISMSSQYGKPLYRHRLLLEFAIASLLADGWISIQLLLLAGILLACLLLLLWFLVFVVCLVFQKVNEKRRNFCELWINCCFLGVLLNWVLYR